MIAGMSADDVRKLRTITILGAYDIVVLSCIVLLDRMQGASFNATTTNGGRSGL